MPVHYTRFTFTYVYVYLTYKYNITQISKHNSKSSRLYSQMMTTIYPQPQHRSWYLIAIYSSDPHSLFCTMYKHDAHDDDDNDDDDDDAITTHNTDSSCRVSTSHIIHRVLLHLAHYMASEWRSDEYTTTLIRHTTSLISSSSSWFAFLENRRLPFLANLQVCAFTCRLCGHRTKIV